MALKWGCSKPGKKTSGERRGPANVFVRAQSFTHDSRITLEAVQLPALCAPDGFLHQETERWCLTSGKRFALEFSQERGDPSILLYEYFTVFDVESLQPLAMVRVSEMPERQSWSAFSSDGQFFVVGNPNDLSLYKLQ